MKLSKRKRKRDSWGGKKLSSAKLVKESFANALCGSTYTYLLLRKIICVRFQRKECSIHLRLTSRWQLDR